MTVLKVDRCKCVLTVFRLRCRHSGNKRKVVATADPTTWRCGQALCALPFVPPLPQSSPLSSEVCCWLGQQRTLLKSRRGGITLQSEACIHRAWEQHRLSHEEVLLREEVAPSTESEMVGHLLMPSELLQNPGRTTPQINSPGELKRLMWFFTLGLNNSWSKYSLCT